MVQDVAELQKLLLEKRKHKKESLMFQALFCVKINLFCKGKQAVAQCSFLADRQSAAAQLLIAAALPPSALFIVWHSARRSQPASAERHRA